MTRESCSSVSHYVVLEGADLKNVAAFAYGDYLRILPEKSRQQLFSSRSDDEDPSEANAERPVSEDGHSSECGSKEIHIGRRTLGTAGLEFLED